MADNNTRARVSRKLDTLLKLQEVLQDVLDEDIYYEEWCLIGLPDGASKKELVDLFEDNEKELNTIFRIAVDLLRRCNL